MAFQPPPRGLQNLMQSGYPYKGAQRAQMMSPTAMQILPSIARQAGGVVQAPSMGGLHSLAPRIAPHYAMAPKFMGKL